MPCATCQLGVADLFFDGKNDDRRAKLRIRFKQARPAPCQRHGGRNRLQTRIVALQMRIVVLQTRIIPLQMRIVVLQTRSVPHPVQAGRTCRPDRV
jgi:hypothetical protein